MRARLIRAPILLLLIGCSDPEPQLPPSSAPASTAQRIADTVSHPQSTLLSGYALTDTTEWGNPLEEGKRAILRRNGAAIDTVDLEFGVAAVGRDSLVFLPVRTATVPLSTDPVPSYESYPTEHVFWTPMLRRELRDFLPFFKANSSSPRIAREAIHYWGIAPSKSAKRLYAIRYDFRTARLDSLFLNREDALATDYRYHLGVPQIEGDKVSFDGVILDSATWRVIRQDLP